MTALHVNSPDDADPRQAATPTSADVARRAKVSRATVSYVLNGVTTQKISDKTREAVQRAAEELGYRPNLAAQTLAAGTSRIALFVVPSVYLGALSIEMSSHLTARAAERGVTLIVHFEGPASRPVIDVAKDLRPRVVFSMWGLDDDTLRWLLDRGIPSISLLQGSDLVAPAIDRSTWLQVEHLAAQGHTALGYADTTESGLEVVAQNRRRSAADACEQQGLAAPAYERFDLDGREAEDKVRRWVGAGVTAVAAYNDEVAITVLAGIRHAGLRCPEDLAVIGVDELAINASMVPPLSSIAFDIPEVARRYAEALPDLLDGAAAPMRDINPSDFMRLVARESTASPPKKGNN